MAEGMTEEEATAAANKPLPFHILTDKAEGGRVPMIYGGSAGLKAMWKEILKNVSKTQGKKIEKFFPKMDVEMRELTKLGEKLDPTSFKAFNVRERDLKLEGIEHIISRLKQDKKMIQQVAANKAMKDEGLDFLMKHLIEKSGMYPKYLKKYTNIDKDILNMETIKKNLIMKDRKLNAEGGRVPLAGGKGVLKGLMALANKIAPGSTKIGQTSKTMAERTQLKQAISGFQERRKAAELKEMIRKKYKGVVDERLLNNMLIDDNPQRLAEVMATVDEALIMQGKGMGPNQIIQATKDAWKRKKNASGGIAGMLGE
jgi:hypothetical protein